MKTFLLAIILALAFSADAYPQNKSVYTSTKTSACRTIEATDDGTGSYIGECAGVSGYKVQLLEGDIRQTLNVITPAKKKFELNFWGFYGSFSSIGEKIEWRTKSGVPVALIARFRVADPADSRKSTSLLMISKIERNSACVTDIVYPGEKQNEAARTLADTAALRVCKLPE